MTKKPIMIIGVGQCGGNIAEDAELKGFTSVAMNSYKGDLDILRWVSTKIHFQGFSGAGKNREKGKDSLKENLEDVIGKIVTIANDPAIEVITVVFSTDGGTGSGCGPLLINILTDIFPHKIVNAITVLPKFDESLGSFANSVECISELSNIENMGACFFIDNNKVRNRLPNYTTKKELYRLINSSIIGLLDNVCKASNQKSFEGNFDGADLLSVLGTRGAALISEVNTRDVSIINQEIKDSWNNSIFITPEYDQRIVNAGFIYRTSNEMIKALDKTLIFSQLGIPIEVYEGFYNSERTITTIISGLTFPITRLKDMEHVIESNKQRIEDNMQSSTNQKYETNSNWVNNLRNPNKKQKTDNSSLTDKLNKFR
jgi:cell division GTPase FtsZ